MIGMRWEHSILSLAHNTGGRGGFRWGPRAFVWDLNCKLNMIALKLVVNCRNFLALLSVPGAEKNNDIL